MGIEFEPREAILSHKEGVDVIPSNKLLTGKDMSLITVDDRKCVLNDKNVRLFVLLLESPKGLT